MKKHTFESLNLWVELNKVNALIPLLKKFIKEVEDDTWIDYQGIGNELVNSGYFGSEEVEDILDYWWHGEIKELTKTLKKMEVKQKYLKLEYIKTKKA